MEHKKVNTHLVFRSLVTKFFDQVDEFDSEQDWKAFEELLLKKELKYLTKNINGFILIFNYRTGHYEFVSESITSNLGFPVNDFLGAQGTQKVYSLILEKHALLFLDPILKDVLGYLSTHVTSTTGLDYRFSCSLKLGNVKGIYQWHILDTVVIQAEDNGLPKRTLITITNIEQYKKDDLVYYNVMKKDTSGIYQVVFEGYANQEINDEQLTSREIEILSLIAQGLTNQKIAEKLFISDATVKAHRRNILSKTNCKGPVELANFAFSRGLI